MTQLQDTLWQTKLHARLHDPAEKALVLLRDPAGHEGGNSRVLWRLARHDAGPAEGNIDNDNADVIHAVAFSNGIKPATYKTVQRADWWAAAADRPQWPMQEITVPTKKGEQKTFGVAPWAQVSWTKSKDGKNNTVLIHPLTGEKFELPGGLSETDLNDIKERAFSHLSRLLLRNDGVTDFKKTLLAMWRFGPELSEENDNGKLGELWKLLPADTRIPDHSIWDHLDLTSAFAGAFTADPAGEAALLTLSIGPVQPFIAAARKVEDLWAGSHLLARLSWEAMKVVAGQLGPDAVLFPRLRGVPQVDLWLRDECELPDDLFKDCYWNRGSTDSNPLFSAALPNRFVAVVPASQAKTLALEVENAVRHWLQQQGKTVVRELLEAAGHASDEAQTPVPFAQMREQLQGFPEVHWASVPFSLVHARNAGLHAVADQPDLSTAMRPFFGTGEGQPCGFLDTEAWKLLQKDLQLVDEHGRKTTFFTPNPGVLYPAIHDLAERALAAAKAVRPFAQSQQQGWRCSLSGETEWLTTDRAQLDLPAGQRRSSKNKGFREGQHQETLWTKVADKYPAWAKAGEHLGALAAIKRLWPTLFADEVGKALDKRNIGRFVVSTHTMALAGNLEKLDQRLRKEAETELSQFLTGEDKAPALPPKLAHLRGSLAARIPAAQDRLQDSDGEEEQRTLQQLQGQLRNLLGHAPETYYSLLLMDGDRMGAWLAGEGDGYAISYRDSFHPQVQTGFDKHAAQYPAIQKYGQQKRALSPNRHLAISGALNDFSLTVVRHVVENEHLGRLIYAGGDDVFAMLPVADLLPAMQRLRHAYSGHDPEHEGGRDARGLTLHKGFAFLNGKLMRMMGTKATASCGAVIAHHQAPLSAVRRELHTAEQRAKNEGGRNAYSITIVKRSGGALRLTAKWGEPLNLLQTLRDFLAADGVSRRAAYHTLQWLDKNELPAPQGDGAMLQTLLAYQFARQAEGPAKAQAEPLAQRLTALTLQQPEDKRIDWLRNFISVAEFLAREVRNGGALA